MLSERFHRNLALAGDSGRAGPDGGMDSVRQAAARLGACCVRGRRPGHAPPVATSMTRACRRGGSAHDFRSRLGAAAARGCPSPGWLWEWRSSARRAALLLKAAAILAVLLALAQPRLTVYETKVALAVLVDTSASVSPADLATASDLATRIQKKRAAGNVTHGSALCARPRARRRRRRAARTGTSSTRPREPAHATNLEAALREGVGSLPAGLVPRVAADFRRQREPGQRHARHLAGAAVGHSDRYDSAGRPSEARPATGIGEHSRRRFSVASASRSMSSLRSPKARQGHGRDHRGRQVARDRARWSSRPG